MSEWFEDWFASDLYLDVYKHRDEKDALKLLELINNNIPLSKNNLILDAACGAGRYSKILAERGYNVVGFDLSLPLLKNAKNNFEEMGLQDSFFRADLREVRLKQKFNLILNVFTSFGYFDTDEENFAFIRNSLEFLEEGGYFIFDYINKSYLKKTLVPRSEKRINDYDIIENRDIINERVIKKIEITSGKKKYNFVESVRLYTVEEIINKFAQIGYRKIIDFGNYNGEKFDELESERLIIIFQK